MLPNGVWQPRNKRDVPSDGMLRNVTGVTFHGVEFVRHKKSEISMWPKNSTTLGQDGPVIGGVLENFNHGYDVEARRGERELFAGGQKPRDTRLERGQIG